ncbi:MAG: multidrug effflux MFS transporter [Chlamydiales bacterium]|nr:multidrug effflux MFS transporter [Chlamydiales bacterium]
MKHNTRNIRILYLFPILLILYEFSINMSNDMYLPALIVLTKEFDVSSHIIQLTIVAWLLGSASIQLILGPVSDKHGRRPVFFLGGVIFLISTIVCALAPSIIILIIARFFQGMAVSCLMVAGYASIHEIFEDKTSIRILSWMGSAAICAPIIGPILGGYILYFSTWRMIFILLFLLSFLTLIALWKVMPESNLDSNEKSLAPKKLLHSYLNIFLNKKFMTKALPTGCLYSGIIIWITAAPFIIMDLFQIPEQYFGFTQVPIFLGYIVGASIMRVMLDRFNISFLGLLGITVSIISALILLLLTLDHSNSIWYLILPMVGYTFGCGFANAPMTKAAFASTDEDIGAVTAFFYLKLAGLGALGSLIVSIVYTHTILPISILLFVVSLIAWTIHVFTHLFASSKEL